MSAVLDGQSLLDTGSSLVAAARDVAADAPLGALAASLRADARLAGRPVALPHPLVLTVRESEHVVLVTPAAVWEHGRELLKPFADELARGRAAMVLLGRPGARALDEALARGLCALASAAPDVDALYVAIHAAFELIEARLRAELRGEWVNRYRYEIGEFVEIARAINTEREIDKLLSLILEKSRLVTGADAGSIYVIEGDEPELARRSLRFKQAQNDSVSFDYREFTMPVSAQSIAGYVALQRSMLNIADVYELPPESPYGFDRSFDEKAGYRGKSMLCTPLLSRVGDVIGVIQLINRKRDPRARLLGREDDGPQIIAFDQRSEQTLSTLASLAGISLENAMLYAENQRMLEGFVRASVEAIEQRDPTTSGHSIRVAEMTVSLARAVERSEKGLYRDVRWTHDDLRELEYASLLHDFGKIGVSEQVLIKAKKLYPHELDAVRQRFALARRAIELEVLRRKVQILERGGDSQALCALEQEMEERRQRLDAAFAIIVEANEPKVLSGGDYAMLETLARESFNDDGTITPLLRDAEVLALSVPRGSLTPSEYDEIRSHVVHTYEFLSTIPWGRKFRRVAHIAGAHHERLDGTGYPNRLRATEIPLQSKIMTVSDIFDALTAADRPYKKAVPLDRALAILHMEVEQHHIDGELVRIFTEAKVWEKPPSS